VWWRASRLPWSFALGSRCIAALPAYTICPVRRWMPTESVYARSVAAHGKRLSRHLRADERNANGVSPADFSSSRSDARRLPRVALHPWEAISPSPSSSRRDARRLPGVALHPWKPISPSPSSSRRDARLLPGVALHPWKPISPSPSSSRRDARILPGGGSAPLESECPSPSSSRRDVRRLPGVALHPWKVIAQHLFLFCSAPQRGARAFS